MKTFILVILTFIIIAPTIHAQRLKDKLIIGQIDSIHSSILNEGRQLWIYVPENGGVNEKYPVLYLLDGESYFYSTAALAKQLSGVLPNMIIVGIINTNRNHDLTPTPVNPSRGVSQDYAKASGGGEKFLEFMDKELFPYIESKYNTAPYRIFSGHSLGGLTVVNALINHPTFFNAYIAIDPSLWWDNQKLLKQAEKTLSDHRYDKRSLFVAMANNMPAGMDTTTVLKDTSINTSVTRAVLPFIRSLRSHTNNGLRWSYKFYPNERHGTVQLNGQYDALRFLFNYYQFRTSVFEFNPNLNADSILISHFKTISKNLGYTVLPSEDLVNNLGYTFLGLKKMDKAYAFFEINIKNYPSSWNAYDSMAEYYQIVGDQKKSKAFYAKAETLKKAP